MNHMILQTYAFEAVECGIIDRPENNDYVTVPVNGCGRSFVWSQGVKYHPLDGNIETDDEMTLKQMKDNFIANFLPDVQTSTYLSL